MPPKKSQLTPLTGIPLIESKYNAVRVALGNSRGKEIIARKSIWEEGWKAMKELLEDPTFSWNHCQAWINWAEDKYIDVLSSLPNNELLAYDHALLDFLFSTLIQPNIKPDPAGSQSLSAETMQDDDTSRGLLSRVGYVVGNKMESLRELESSESSVPPELHSKEWITLLISLIDVCVTGRFGTDENHTSLMDVVLSIAADKNNPAGGTLLYDDTVLGTAKLGTLLRNAKSTGLAIGLIDLLKALLPDRGAKSSDNKNLRSAALNRALKPHWKSKAYKEISEQLYGATANFGPEQYFRIISSMQDNHVGHAGPRAYQLREMTVNNEDQLVNARNKKELKYGRIMLYVDEWGLVVKQYDEDGGPSDARFKLTCIENFSSVPDTSVFTFSYRSENEDGRTLPVKLRVHSEHGRLLVAQMTKLTGVRAPEQGSPSQLGRGNNGVAGRAGATRNDGEDARESQRQLAEATAEAMAMIEANNKSQAADRHRVDSPPSFRAANALPLLEPPSAAVKQSKQAQASATAVPNSQKRNVTGTTNTRPSKQERAGDLEANVRTSTTGESFKALSSQTASRSAKQLPVAHATSKTGAEPLVSKSGQAEQEEVNEDQEAPPSQTFMPRAPTPLDRSKKTYRSDSIAQRERKTKAARQNKESASSEIEDEDDVFIDPDRTKSQVAVSYAANGKKADLFQPEFKVPPPRTETSRHPAPTPTLAKSTARSLPTTFVPKTAVPVSKSLLAPSPAAGGKEGGIDGRADTARPTGRETPRRAMQSRITQALVPQVQASPAPKKKARSKAKQQTSPEQGSDDEPKRHLPLPWTQPIAIPAPPAARQSLPKANAKIVPQTRAAGVQSYDGGNLGDRGTVSDENINGADLETPSDIQDVGALSTTTSKLDRFSIAESMDERAPSTSGGGPIRTSLQSTTKVLNKPGHDASTTIGSKGVEPEVENMTVAEEIAEVDLQENESAADNSVEEVVLAQNKTVAKGKSADEETSKTLRESKEPQRTRWDLNKKTEQEPQAASKQAQPEEKVDEEGGSDDERPAARSSKLQSKDATTTDKNTSKSTSDKTKRSVKIAEKIEEITKKSERPVKAKSAKRQIEEEWEKGREIKIDTYDDEKSESEVQSGSTPKRVSAKRAKSLSKPAAIATRNSRKAEVAEKAVESGGSDKESASEPETKRRRKSRGKEAEKPITTTTKRKREKAPESDSSSDGETKFEPPVKRKHKNQKKKRSPSPVPSDSEAEPKKEKKEKEEEEAKPKPKPRSQRSKSPSKSLITPSAPARLSLPPSGPSKAGQYSPNLLVQLGHTPLAFLNERGADRTRAAEEILDRHTERLTKMCGQLIDKLDEESQYDLEKLMAHRPLLEKAYAKARESAIAWNKENKEKNKEVEGVLRGCRKIRVDWGEVVF